MRREASPNIYFLICALLLGLSSKTHWTARAGEYAASQQPSSASTNSLTATLAAFNRGCALLEQYEYSAASREFEQVLAAFPDWTAAKFNLALAYLNMMEEAGGKEMLGKAESLFREVLKERPDLIHGWYSLGILYEHVGDREKALEAFQKAHDLDPRDPHLAFKLAESYLSMGRSEEGVALLEKSVALDPGFVSAIYRLAMQYQRSGAREKASHLFERFRALNQAELAGGSFTVRKIYGSAGRYYWALGADMLPLPRGDAAGPVKIPVFAPEPLEFGDKTAPWEWGRVAVKIPGLAVGDLNSDGALDLIVTGAGSEPSTQVWLGDAKGHFTPGPVLDKQAVCCVLGDVDNDGHLDVLSGGAGFVRLWLGDGQGGFKPADSEGAVHTGDFMALHVRLWDIDGDGDLDLYASRFDKEGRPLQPLLLINNQNGTFTEAAASWGLGTAEFSAVSSAWLDLDNDRDLDILLAPAFGTPFIWMNDRAGSFRLLAGTKQGLTLPGTAGLTTGDVNADGLPDVLILSRGKVRLFLNRGAGLFEEDESFFKKFGSLGGTSAQFADVDNDGDVDLLIADTYRPGGRRGPVLLLNLWPSREFMNAADQDGGMLFAGIEFPDDAAGVLADLNNDGTLDVVFAPLGEKPVCFWNRTTGGNWIQLDLAGTRYKDQKSRSNEAALGARVEVRSGQMLQQWDVGQPAGSTAFAPLRLHFGLGNSQEVEWLRIIWPDSVLQAEVSLKPNQIVKIGEVPRKTSSCPHLFVWNGEKFEFVSDFGGKGGLGYLVRPGVYARPHPREWVPLPQVREKDGQIVCKILEPVEEVVYFDQAILVAADHPEQILVLPHEMMPVGIESLPDELLSFSQLVPPKEARDEKGTDVLELLRSVDRRVVGPHEQDMRFVGYAKPFAIELEFADEHVRQWLTENRRIFLVAHGFVEYSYSQTNFAASQAGVVLRAPTFEVYRGGQWVELAREIGYPAGVNHWMTLELTGLIQPGDNRLRIHTNMDLYWDAIYLAAVADASPQIHQISATAATLDYRGFPREYSPDGRKPLLLDYTNIDLTLPWKSLPGLYTRFGDVLELVTERDNAFVIMGPGEELTVTFDVSRLPPVRPGYRRSWFLKTESFCKDMDLLTGAGDRVEPLPFHEMTQYPFSPPEAFPDTPATRRAREIYNTRRIGHSPYAAVSGVTASGN